MIIMGIDPGTVVAGFAIINMCNGRTVLLECGALAMKSSDSMPDRLGAIHNFFMSKIEQWGVTDLALETPFLGKNAQNFLKLGYVRGVLYLLVNRYQLQLHEFSPSQVKRAVVGCGSADKEQVARVIMRLFPGFVFPERFDVTDAVSVALCGVWGKKTFVPRGRVFTPQINS